MRWVEAWEQVESSVAWKCWEGIEIVEVRVPESEPGRWEVKDQNGNYGGVELLVINMEWLGGGGRTAS